MRIREYIAALWTDWLVLMSGIASVALAFWAAYFPPTNIQAGRTLLWISAVICFAFASYRIWTRERDEREKEIAQLKVNHKAEIEEKEKHFHHEHLNLIEAHTRHAINQEDKHKIKVEGLRAEIDFLKSQIDKITAYKLIFEIETQSRSYVNLTSYYDESFSVKPTFYIRFENSDIHPLIVKRVNVLIIRKDADGTESEIPIIDQELYEVVFEEEHSLSKREYKWDNRNLSIEGRTTTLLHLIKGQLNVFGDYRKVLNTNCFLRVTMETMNQPLYALDFDVNWEFALKDNAGLTSRK